MNTTFTKSIDGYKIAYDCTGTGTAIMLVHGAGSHRLEWHQAGYVDRLQDDYTVITLDLRGHGESDLPTDPSDYTTEKLGGDLLCVADACGVEQFIIWGMSFGGNVSRYLAARSKRVVKMVLMGTKFGAGVPDQIRQEIEKFCVHWPPILQAQREGTLDLGSLSEEDREFLENFNVPVIMAWGRAMLDWPNNTPGDLHCPALWLIGSEDQLAMENLDEYKQSLEGSSVQFHIAEGLTHEQVFERIDEVFPTMLAFTQS